MTKYDPQKHHRRSIRLQKYDYRSPGAYFVTICTQGRECVLDDPVVPEIIRDVWNTLPKRFPTIALDEFVIMPNHIHFILWICPSGTGVGATPAVAQGAGASPAPTECPIGTGASPVPTECPIGAGASPAPTMNTEPTLGNVVGAFKSLVFKAYFDWIQTNDPTRRAKFWQRNYYEHIIRNERELQAIRRYIRLNPDNWRVDRDNPDNILHLPPPQTVDEYVREALIYSE